MCSVSADSEALSDDRGAANPEWETQVRIDASGVGASSSVTIHSVVAASDTPVCSSPFRSRRRTRPPRHYRGRRATSGTSTKPGASARHGSDACVAPSVIHFHPGGAPSVPRARAEKRRLCHLRDPQVLRLLNSLQTRKSVDRLRQHTKCGCWRRAHRTARLHASRRRSCDIVLFTPAP